MMELVDNRKPGGRIQIKYVPSGTVFECRRGGLNIAYILLRTAPDERRLFVVACLANRQSDTLNEEECLEGYRELRATLTIG